MNTAPTGTDGIPVQTDSDAGHAGLGWFGIARLGLVQAALGAVVVLATGALNRIMVLEMGLPALIPGMLVAWHYLIQVARPRLGHGSDQGGRRSPWVLGGVISLALGATGAAVATSVMRLHPVVGVALAFLDYSLIGAGVGCAGTNLLVLLAQETPAERRPAAATVVWIMMIVGFVLTTAVAGRALDPYSAGRTLAVMATVSTCAILVTAVALWRLEPRRAKALQSLPGPARNAASADSATGMRSMDASAVAETSASSHQQAGFLAALRDVWAEPQARRFASFVFIAMLAYSAQELLLDPFAGAVHGYSPGASTRLSSLQHGGALAGMLLVAGLGAWQRGRGLGSPRICTLAGCIGSALLLGLLGLAAALHLDWSLPGMVFVLGVANGSFAVSAIASMMQLVSQGTRRREGVRMGLWGAAQALAFAAGGVSGTGLSDLARMVWHDPGMAYGLVFMLQGALFLWAALLANGLWPRTTANLADVATGHTADSSIPASA